ncbi:MAG: transglycosylase domain-containing protein [Gammaproteobacteria bacterium]|nr:transglycosylase domain-containing protein [Gammaproteobacteria bacterium]
MHRLLKTKKFYATFVTLAALVALGLISYLAWYTSKSTLNEKQLTSLLLPISSHQKLTLKQEGEGDELLYPARATRFKPQLLDRHGRPLTVTYQNSWNYHDRVALHDVPIFLQEAFLLAEDKRFYDHGGVDWVARVSALVQNVLSFDLVRGASTISEQLVKMMHPRPRSLKSKWVEGWDAVRMERLLDKASIFEAYLNQVPYAANRRGIVQAARYYFDRNLDTLNQKEMLALAVLVRAPSRFDLYKSTKKIQSRIDTLSYRMRSLDLLTDDQLTAIKSQKIKLHRSSDQIDVEHFARYVYERLTDKQKAKFVKTTLDSSIQKSATALLNERLSSLKNKNVGNAAMIVIDHHTNEILAWVVGKTSENQAGYFNTVTTPRQPGSTLKPFVFASAMEKGWTAATMISDTPLQEAVGVGVHSYRNYSNSFYGEISLRESLGNSLNIPVIRAVDHIGQEELANKFGQLGFNSLEKNWQNLGSGVALGNGEVSLFDLAQAYSVLAKRGKFEPLTIFTEHIAPESKTVFSKEITSLIADILSDDQARAKEFGSSGVLSYPIQTAVKTGTSNDHRDAWIMGFNHRFLIGVWMGNLDNEPMLKITGSSGPAPLMKSMFAVLNNMVEPRALYLSPDLIATKVCLDSGYLADDGCASKHEYFLPKQIAQHAVSKASVHRSEVKQVTQGRLTQAYKLLAPLNNIDLAFDPRIPKSLQVFQFKLNETKGLYRVEWYLNDRLMAVNSGEAYDWQVERGEFSLQVKLFRIGETEPSILYSNYRVK